MKQHFSTIVVFILAAASLIILLLIAGIIKDAAQGADTACAASVASRMEALKINPQLEVELRGCDTRYADFDGMSDSRVASRIAQDFSWCYESFALAREHSLLSRQETFCHVCAFYQTSEPRALDGVLGRITAVTGMTLRDRDMDGPGYAVVTGDDLPDPQESSLIMDDNIAIVFFQARFDDHPLLQAFYRKWMGGLTGTVIGFVASKAVWGIPYVGPALGVVGSLGGTVGGYFFAERILGDSSAVGGIIITPLNETVVDALGCTTSDPDASSWTIRP